MKHTTKHQNFHRILSNLPLLILSTLLFACSVEERARQALDRGDPFLATRLYEQELNRQPDNPTIQTGLTSARQQAGQILAERAESLLASGHEQRAVETAQEAAKYDPRYCELEAKARRTQANTHLKSAQASLAQGNIQEARTFTQRAEAVANDLPDPGIMHQQINAAEADQLMSDARSYANAGEFQKAERIAVRTANLNPHDPKHADFPTEIGRMEREWEFDKHYIQTRRMLDAGQLRAFDDNIATLQALQVQHERYAELHAAGQQRHKAVAECIQGARSLHDAGEFESALRQFDIALSLVTDYPELQEEREACNIKLQISNLQRDGQIAFDQGNYAKASRLFTRSLEYQSDAVTGKRLNQSNANEHRRLYLQAIEREDDLSALKHLKALVSYEANDDTVRMLNQLRDVLAKSAFTEASQLHNSGRTQQAVSYLDNVMVEIGNAQLVHFRADLAAEKFIQDAVAAEQRGNYPHARNLYQQALATGGDRAAVSGRINDVAILADFQKQLETKFQQVKSLEHELALLHNTVRDREQDINELQSQLTYQKQEASRYRQSASNLAADLQRLQYENRRYHYNYLSWQSELSRLRRDIRCREDEARRWRRKYERECDD